MRRFIAFMAVLLVTSGCADQNGAGSALPDAPSSFEAIADRIAEAWRSWPAFAAWRDGYVPLEEPIQIPADPGFDSDTKLSFGNGWFRLTTPLPAGGPAEGVIRFPDGTLTVPLISAREAYGQLDRGNAPPCPDQSGSPAPAPGAIGPHAVTSTSVDSCITLTVSAVELDTVPVQTSRGEAQVPAWLFTVDEMSGPVARVAVADSAVSPVPTVGVPESSGPADLLSAESLAEVDGTHLTYRISIGPCDAQLTPLVKEYEDVVVVAGRVVRSPGVVLCTERFESHSVTVTLDAPLGTRTVLSLDGLPVRHEGS